MADIVTPLKVLLIPGSFPFLLFGLVVGLWLLYSRRFARWGRLWVSFLVIIYWIMSTPALTHPAVLWTTAAFVPLATAAQAGGATAIVLLDGGAYHYHAHSSEMEALTEQTALRTLEAARVYRLLDRPWVIVTGGLTSGWPDSRTGADVIRDHLVALGVPADRIIVERKARTTHEHAVYVPPILRAHHIERFVLVTSPTHMRRSLNVFKAAGVAAVPSPAPAFVDRTPRSSWWRPYVPSLGALALSEAVMYDLIGTVYYWSRGWI